MNSNRAMPQGRARPPPEYPFGHTPGTPLSQARQAGSRRAQAPPWKWNNSVLCQLDPIFKGLSFRIWANMVVCETTRHISLAAYHRYCMYKHTHTLSRMCAAGGRLLLSLLTLTLTTGWLGLAGSWLGGRTSVAPLTPPPAFDIAAMHFVHADTCCAPSGQ